LDWRLACGVTEFMNSFLLFVKDKGELLPLTIVMNRSAQPWLHNKSSVEKGESEYQFDG
jgi:hypothetical protein